MDKREHTIHRTSCAVSLVQGLNLNQFQRNQLKIDCTAYTIELRHISPFFVLEVSLQFPHAVPCREDPSRLPTLPTLPTSHLVGCAWLCFPTSCNALLMTARMFPRNSEEMHAHLKHLEAMIVTYCHYDHQNSLDRRCFCVVFFDLQNLSFKSESWDGWDVSCLFASPQGMDLSCSGHPNRHLASSSWDVRRIRRAL